MNGFSRRDMARGAMLGGASLGASLLMGSAVLPAQQTGTHGTMLDARALGAAGDGKTDDTAALQKALDAAGAVSGCVFLPPGIYLTHELHVRPGTALVGIPAWNYGSGGGSVLKLAGTDSKCLLNLTDSQGATIDGVSLEGGDLGTGIHGILTDRTKWADHEDGFRIERCQVAHFSGDGMHLDCVWCFSVRHCEMIRNRGDGMNMRGWDGFILDNWFSGNLGAGFAARRENAAMTFTGNRIEWNEAGNFIIMGGDGYQITGNYFDRAGKYGIALLKRNGKGPTQVTITGNFFKRSGKSANPDSYDSSQIYIEGATGVTCIGNSLWSGRDDGNEGVWSPSYGIVYQGLENCVIRNNALHDAALRQLMVDLGGHGEGVSVGENPGRLFVVPK